MNVHGYVNGELIGIFPDRREGLGNWSRSIQNPMVRMRFVKVA